MIEYNARSWSDTILRWRGSVVPDVLPHMLQTGLLAVLICRLDASGVNVHIEKTGHAMFGFFVTFLVIFRVNNAVRAYSDGSALLDRFHEVACELMRGAIPKARGIEVVPHLRRQVLQVAGLMIMHLRDEPVEPGLERLRVSKLLNAKEIASLAAVVQQESFPSRRSRDFSTGAAAAVAAAAADGGGGGTALLHAVLLLITHRVVACCAMPRSSPASRVWFVGPRHAQSRSRL